jgi:hypothetical protein
MIRHKAGILIAGALFLAGSTSLSFGQGNRTKSPSENGILTSGEDVTALPHATGPEVTSSSVNVTESTASTDGEIAPAEAAPGQTQADAQDHTQSQAPPSNNSQAPSLEDLGLSSSQTQGDPQLQAKLDKRAHMLKIHQRLGLITAIPMIATVATSFGAGGRSTSTSDRWAHLALGAATGDLYFTAAYFAIRAPGIPGTRRRGPIRVHRALAWVHGPGMILTPILGAIAFDQKSKGEKVHGIASAHGPVAIVTAGAFAAALLSVSFKF